MFFQKKKDEKKELDVYKVQNQKMVSKSLISQCFLVPDLVFTELGIQSLLLNILMYLTYVIVCHLNQAPL